MTSEEQPRAQPHLSGSGSRVSTAHAQDYLLCSIGASALCALPLSDVAETMRPLPLAPLRGARAQGEHESKLAPRLPAFVLGVAVIRGAVTPVLDAAQLVGAQEPCESTRFVALKLSARPCALAVTSVLGVRSLSPGDSQALPPFLDALGADAIRTLRTQDQRLLWILESVRLVPESVWHLIAERAKQ